MKNQGIYDSDWINIDGNMVHRTAVIYKENVIMGTGNYIGAYSVIGGNGEMRDVDQKEFRGIVRIGNNNVISEIVTIQRPFLEGNETIIGDNNIIMAHSHIGHDAIVGDGCEICSGAIVGGYVSIEDKAKIKLGVVIRNRVSIGKGAIVGLGSVVTKDVNASSVSYGNPAKEISQI